MSSERVDSLSFADSLLSRVGRTPWPPARRRMSWAQASAAPIGLHGLHAESARLDRCTRMGWTATALRLSGARGSTLFALVHLTSQHANIGAVTGKGVMLSSRHAKIRGAGHLGARAGAAMRFTEKQVDDGIAWMLGSGHVSAERLVTYTDILRAAGIHLPPPGYLPKLARAYMESVHWRCQEQGLPPIDALVVNADGERKGYPGTGYFRINEHADPLDLSLPIAAREKAHEFWEQQREECRLWRAP